MLVADSGFIVLYTREVEKTEAFYRMMGGEIGEFTREKVVVSFAGYALHFVLDISEPFEEYRYVAETGEFGRGSILYIESDNLEQDWDRVLEAKGTITSEILVNHWGAREFLFEDPSGCVWAVYQMLEEE